MSPTEIVVALIGLLGIIVPVYVVNRRGTKADDNAQQIAEHTTLFAGYEGFLERVQEDNLDLRNRVAALERELAGVRQELREANERISELLRRGEPPR